MQVIMTWQYFTPSASDEVALMVGDECRGKAFVGDGLLAETIMLTAYGKKEQETAQLLYYNSESRDTWDLNTNIDITAGDAEIKL